MKKTVTLLTAILFCGLMHAQDVELKLVLEEGISLYDRGKYEDALKKFDEVLAKEPGNFGAVYEKANTLMMMEKYEDCIQLCKQALGKFSYEPELKKLYVTYGSAVDYQSGPAKAIEVYDEGLQKFPGYFLLNFNKGITYQRMGKLASAYATYQLAVQNNHFHASSWLRIAELLKTSNKIPAVLASVMQLLAEPESDRAAPAFENMMQLIGANVKKVDDKKITINLDASMLDKKGKKLPDDFHLQEFTLSLSAALDYDSANQKKTALERFESKMETLTAMFSEDKEPHAGFFWENVCPFFVELKKKGYLNTLSHIIFSSQDDARNKAWLKTHPEKLSEFYKWAANYKWPGDK